MTTEEQNMMDSLSRNVTALCEAIDPTHTHGPETEKIVAHAKATRYAIRMMYETAEQNELPGKLYILPENLRRLGVLDALQEPKPANIPNGLL